MTVSHPSVGVCHRHSHGGVSPRSGNEQGCKNSVVIALGWQSGWRSAPLFSRALRLTI